MVIKTKEVLTKHVIMEVVWQDVLSRQGHLLNKGKKKGNAKHTRNGAKEIAVLTHM